MKLNDFDKEFLSSLGVKPEANVIRLKAKLALYRQRKNKLDPVHQLKCKYDLPRGGPGNDDPL
jgi:hypothetical protein